MRVVERPVLRPMHCAVIPFIGQTAEGERWIDTGSELLGIDPRVYVSATAVREMAALLGYPTPEEHAALQEMLERAQEYADELELDVTSNTAVEEATALLRGFAPTPEKTKVAA